MSSKCRARPPVPSVMVYWVLVALYVYMLCYSVKLSLTGSVHPGLLKRNNRKGSLYVCVYIVIYICIYLRNGTYANCGMLTCLCQVLRSKRHVAEMESGQSRPDANSWNNV